MLKRISKGEAAFHIFNYIFLGFCVLITLFPFATIIAKSFSSTEAIESGKVFLLPVDFNLSAYKNMLDDGQLLHSMFNSVIVTVVGTCLNMIFTTTAAYALSKKRLHGRNIIMKLMVFTMMFSGGTIPHFILVQSLGLMNSYWALWLPGLITIYNLIVMKTFFEGLPESLEEAARIDGASELMIFFRIILPLSMASLATIALFYAVSWWNEYFSGMIYIHKSSLMPMQVKLDDWQTKKSVSAEVVRYKEWREKFSLTDEKMGLHDLKIKVYSEEGLVAYDEDKICLIDFYERKPFDEYNPVGINLGSGMGRLANTYENGFETLAKIGIYSIRDSFEWQTVETEKGMYKLSDSQHIKRLAIKDNNMIDNSFMIAYGNQVATGRESSDKMYPPNTMEGVQAYTDYGIKAAKDLVGVPVLSFELWNEPNLATFWKPSPDFWQYTQMAKAATFDLKKEFPDKDVLVASTASQEQPAFFEVLLRNNIIEYADELSIHPYTYPYDPDERHIVRVPQYLEGFENYGGWMNIGITEYGWPTHDAYNGTAYDDQAVYFIKSFIFNEEMGIDRYHIYCARDTGEEKAYVEHNFGIMEYDGTPKPAMVAISQFNNVLSTAQYQGEFILAPELRSFVYQAGSEPVVITWAPDAEIKGSYTLKEGEYAEDMFGNRINESIITIGKEPIYIFGMSKDCFAKVIAHDTSAIYDELYERFGEKIDLTELREFKESLPDVYKGASNVTNNLNRYFDIINLLVDRGMADKDMSVNDTAFLAYAMYKKGESMANAIAGGPLVYKASEHGYDETKKLISDVKGDEPDSSLHFTDAIIRYADRASYNLEKLMKTEDFDGKKQKKDIYRFMLDKTCALARTMLKHETPDSGRAMFTYSKSTQMTVYQGKKYTFSSNLENLRNKDFNGYAVWVDETGKELGERVPLSVPSGENKEFEISGNVPYIKDAGKYVYAINYVEDGKIVKRQEQGIEFRNLINFHLAASMTTLSDMENVTVEMTNTSDESLTGTIIIEGPDGWSFDSVEKAFTVEAGQTQDINFGITEYLKKPFNEYCFKLSVKDTEGNIISQQEVLLDFRISVYDENDFSPESFDGSVSGWEDAYPIYIAAPEINPGDINSWKGQNRAMKVLSKWNNNAMYILADVYDSVFNNTYTGFDIWQGDSVQVAIDTEMNGLAEGTKTGYQADDYEFGYAVTPNGTETYIYFGPGLKAGDMGSQVTKIIRDDSVGVTRYLIKLPKEIISQFELAEGKEYSFNIAANDADVLLREGYVQYTNGITDSKNPSLFKRFKLLSSDGAADLPNDSSAFIQQINEIRTGH